SDAEGAGVGGGHADAALEEAGAGARVGHELVGVRPALIKIGVLSQGLGPDAQSSARDEHKHFGLTHLFDSFVRETISETVNLVDRAAARSWQCDPTGGRPRSRPKLKPYSNVLGLR